MKSNSILIKFLLLISVVVFSFQVKAIDHTESSAAYNHLFEVNKQWIKYKELVPTENISFNSDAERIHYHLNSVIAFLKSNTSENLSAAELENRMSLINTLQSYANAETFPTNIGHQNRQPYFIDHKGVHCAVGYLIAASNAPLAQQISKEYNFDYIADIKTDGLMEWANTAGFTADELALIQPTYGWEPCDFPVIHDSSISIISNPDPYTYVWDPGVIIPTPPPHNYTCINGIDDDGDGLIDLNDEDECDVEEALDGQYNIIETEGDPCGADNDFRLYIEPLFMWPITGGCGCSQKTDYQWYYDGVAIPSYLEDSLIAVYDLYNSIYPEEGPGAYSLVRTVRNYDCTYSQTRYDYQAECLFTSINEPNANKSIIAHNKTITTDYSGEISIYTIRGQLIHQSQLDGSTIYLQSSGIHIVKIYSEGQIITEKVDLN